MSKTYQDLIKQRMTLDAEIEKARNEGIAEAWRQIDKILAENAIDEDEFRQHYFPASKQRKTTKGRTATPKYRSGDGKHTWAGRGQKPKWLVQALAADKKGKLEDFLIEAPQ